jgi:hypothetical protein
MAGGLADFVQGAGGGALAGAGVGGLPGAIIGGAAGGFLGLFGGNKDEEENKKRLEDYYNEVRTRGAPQVGYSAQAGYSGFRDNQKNLVSHLEAMSQGRGPSLAAEQFKASTNRNIAQQQGLALSGQGNATAAAMMAANNSAQLGAQASQDAGMARIGEQQMALNQLGLTLHGARGADEDMDRFNAGQTNQFALANLDAQLRARGMDDATRLQILNQQAGRASSPSLGQQLLAGGAGLYSMAATQNSLNRGSQTPATGPGTRLGDNSFGGTPYAPGTYGR